MGSLLLLILIGLLIGVFVIALGGGGGAIYLGVLTALFHLAPASAEATSIITALPALMMGAWSYYRKGLINFPLGNRMLIAAIPSVFIGYFLSPYIPEKIYKLIIGLILIVLGLQIIYGLFRHGNHNRQSNSSPQFASIMYGVLGGLMVGIAGLSGGGPITAGLLILGIPMARVSATSAYVLVGMSIVGAVLHLTGGAIDWSAALGLIIGSLVGSLLAPPVIVWLSKNPRREFYVKLFMGIFIVVMGIKSL